MLDKIIFDIEKQLCTGTQISIAIVGNDEDFRAITNKLMSDNILYQVSPNFGFTTSYVLKDEKGAIELIHEYFDYSDYIDLKGKYIDTLYLCSEVSELKEAILKDLLKPKNIIKKEQNKKMRSVNTDRDENKSMITSDDTIKTYCFSKTQKCSNCGVSLKTGVYKPYGDIYGAVCFSECPVCGTKLNN